MSRCPMHEFSSDYTCPVKPCKYAGKSDEEVSGLAREAIAHGKRMSAALVRLYGLYGMATTRRVDDDLQLVV